jgi:hypothetical protein
MSWRKTMRQFVRDVLTGSAATAITNAASAITSRIRRGAAKSTITVPPQQLSTPLVTELERPVALYQPRSLQAMGGERVLRVDRHSKSLFTVVDESTAMKNNSIIKEINVKKLFSLKIFSMGQITHRKPQKSFLLSCHTCQRFSGIVICISASPYNQRGIVRSLLTKPENFGNQNFIACWHKLCLLLFTSLVV